MDVFWLGTHMPEWVQRTDVPLFLSRRRLCRRKKWPTALGPWALDSGGFSELSMFGRWTIGEQQYVDEIRLWSEQMGGLSWAAAQDWMCEPWITEKTGLTVEEHQYRTVENFVRLREMAPEIHFTPVLQGWAISDYERCVRIYESHGVDLQASWVVGVGSVCRRQATDEAVQLMQTVKSWGFRTHGFGFKVLGLKRTHQEMVSADSLAWSFNARATKTRLPGCTHARCNNCLKFALLWRERLMASIYGPGLTSADPVLSIQPP